MLEERLCEGNRYGSCCHTFEAVRASSAFLPRAEFCPRSCPQKKRCRAGIVACIT